MPRFARNDGFTIAEVLITLVIIGVIAAITIPTMMNNKRNEELRAGLLKAQSTLAGALERYYLKNGERITPTIITGSGGATKLKKAISPFLYTIKDCGAHNCISSNNNNPYHTYNNSNSLYYAVIDDGQFIMNDGMMVLIENDNSSIFISVDVNGYKKKPNKAGHDLFSFQINSKGNLIPMGAKGTKFQNETLYCSATSNNVNNGLGCTAKALADPNYFKNLH